MAGVYLHIPFCKRKCFYCDFYKSTNLRLKDDFLLSLKKEIEGKSDFLRPLNIDTFYIGGGTPSVLSGDELLRLFDLFRPYVDFSLVKELTIEVNPDDFTPEWLLFLKRTPVNRISFGLQTVDDGLLKLMNRRHVNRQSIDAVMLAAENGYSNISVDLIYGLPGLTNDQWLETLSVIGQLPIQHVSAYHLIYEQGTVFYNRLQKGNLAEVDEELSLFQFNALVDVLSQYGFDQYELSAFSKPGFRSQHNTLYWEGGDYLGFGPSAHSFYQNQRLWNVSNVNEYIRLLNLGESVCQSEVLSEIDRYNEAVMLGLRTLKGVSVSKLKSMPDVYYSYFVKQSAPYFQSGALVMLNDFVVVASSSLFITDRIVEDLFFVD